MHTALSDILAGIALQPQRQDGTNDQLRDLRVFANRLGLYDAADFLRKGAGDTSPDAQEPAAVETLKRESLKHVLASVPQRVQRQDGTDDQLRDLRAFAYRLGLYDASDYIRAVLERQAAPVSAARRSA